MDFSAFGFGAPLGGGGDDSSNHSASETCALPAYLRAPEVTGQVMAEYIWLAGGGQLRSKTRVLETKPSCAEEAPIMVVESNPGNQMAEPNYELFLKPRKIFRDPFRGGDHILVLCDTFFAAQVAADESSVPATVLQPSETNSRVACENVLKVAEQEQPVFAVEQEYAVGVQHPIPLHEVPFGPRRPTARSSSSSCGGSRKSQTGSASRGGSAKAGQFGKVAPSRATAMPTGSCETEEEHVGATKQQDVHSLEGLHSYKIGPGRGIDVADDLWTSRYLLQRVAEDHGTAVSWQPDAMPQERPLGCYFKYSTAASRQAPAGLGVIGQQLARLQATHLHHQFAYNDGKLERLAAPEASSFTHAVGSAAASVVVPSLTYMQQGGYYTDRRPPADADPYKVTLMLAATTLDIPLPKLSAAASASGLAPSLAAGPSLVPAAVGRGGCGADAAYSPMSSFLMAVRRQQHCMYDSESEECDSVDEDTCMTEDSAALLAKMDDDGCGAEGSSCESDFDEDDDASSSPIAGWSSGDIASHQGEGI
ncbi:hypothetical protein GPECTOR_57g524 [Gonium pectorale]|uniref:glutamine synthetase n=1 Tax=Gonium pectorale TaxID=33097 RepID=A0A150G5Y4_GONPE|nr:hypothetical protein GPECTOR_57g524 [Gonium pectorale]|eukprot:KXZ45234.1 hypothetical protein GPECTOR_57g524 [Gonium pectorale]